MVPASNTFDVWTIKLYFIDVLKVHKVGIETKSIEVLFAIGGDDEVLCVVETMRERA